jgi:hypothetical protein
MQSDFGFQTTAPAWFRVAPAGLCTYMDIYGPATSSENQTETADGIFEAQASERQGNTPGASQIESKETGSFGIIGDASASAFFEHSECAHAI